MIAYARVDSKYSKYVQNVDFFFLLFTNPIKNNKLFIYF